MGERVRRERAERSGLSRRWCVALTSTVPCLSHAYSPTRLTVYQSPIDPDNHVAAVHIALPTIMLCVHDAVSSVHMWLGSNSMRGLAC